ncbi:Inner membrane protein YccS [Clostridium perfringens]|uniref:FUSC family protein n=1 Tax=Clostridium perfringens TaxID=1502 RepID=UPI000E19D2ED|nr:FUSC family protein [Clostridium perfringens]MDG6877112.1 Inner membrane protein YccS [Clostridium perfringens]MDG6880865.1 Inner membrane protein YccS [Clostridium perfringens]MDG6884320.1 Inner membrane protein YccS [Clostridium perfringens]MDG6886927.1 Inner membrane protein YccS [Clostridium perfringens]MDH5078232.1 Inner membrane protein YccS [Clostridium perfringens]
MEVNSIGKTLKKALPPTILSMVLLLVNLKFFGLSNIIIAIYMTLTFIRMRTYLIIENNIFKPLFIQLAIGVLASVASMGGLLEVLINFFGIIILVYLLTDEYNPDSYFPYLMAFVLLQMFPVKFDQISNRLLGIFVSYIIVYLALMIVSPKGEDNKIQELIKSGFENIHSQFKNLYYDDIDKVKSEQIELFDICRELNRFVYSGGRRKYYQIMIAFQHINNIIHDLKSSKEIIEENKKEFKRFYKLFKYLENNFKDYKLCAERLEEFEKEFKFHNKNLTFYTSLVLRYLSESIEHLNYHRFNLRKFLNFKNNKDYFQVYSKYNLKLNEFKLRFAIRMSVIVTLAFFVIRRFSLPKGYWLPMTVFILALPFYEDSKARVYARFRGTILGVIVAFLLFSVFKGQEMHFVIILVTTFFMYAFKDYATMSIYVTCYALAITTISMSDGEAVILRLLYTGIAAIVVLFANKFILPNKNHVELINMVKKLIDLDKVMITKAREALEKDFDEMELRRIIYSSYLISGRIHMHTNPSDKKEDKEIKKFMLSNSEFTTSIINYAVILSNSNKGALDYEYINEGISLIEEKLRSFTEEFFYKSNYIGSFCKNIQLINREDNYKNYCLIKCVDRVYNLEKNLNILKRTIIN